MKTLLNANKNMLTTKLEATEAYELDTFNFDGNKLVDYVDYDMFNLKHTQRLRC